MIRVVVVDDQEPVRTGLRALAVPDGDIAGVGEARDRAAGVRAVRAHRPEVVLMDLRMPGTDGLAATRAIIADPGLAGVRVLVLTTFDDDDDVLAAIRAGAAGYPLKDVAPADLRAAVRVVAAAEALLSPSLTRTVVEGLARRPEHRVPRLLADLTSRKREVLARVGRGESKRRGRAAPAPEPGHGAHARQPPAGQDRGATARSWVVLAYESGLVVPGTGEEPR